MIVNPRGVGGKSSQSVVSLRDSFDWHNYKHWESLAQCSCSDILPPCRTRLVKSYIRRKRGPTPRAFQRLDGKNELDGKDEK